MKKALLWVVLILAVAALVSGAFWHKKLGQGDPPLKSAYLIYDDSLGLFKAEWKPATACIPDNIPLPCGNKLLLLERIPSSGSEALYSWRLVDTRVTNYPGTIEELEVKR